MTPTTPSPISDQAAGERIDMTLLAEQQAAFDKWWPQWRHLCPDRAGACVAFVAGMDAERSTAPTTGSAPEAFYDGSSKEPCLMWAYDGYVPGPNDVVLHATSPAASVLSDEKPVSMFQFDERWKTWAQVDPNYAQDPDVIPLYRHPSAAMGADARPVAWATKLPSGNLSSVRPSLKGAQKRTAAWNERFPNPPHAVTVALCECATRDAAPSDAQDALWTRHGSVGNEWWSLGVFSCHKKGDLWTLCNKGEEIARHEYLQEVMNFAALPDAMNSAWEKYNKDCQWGHEPTARGIFEDGYRAASAPREKT